MADLVKLSDGVGELLKWPNLAFEQVHYGADLCVNYLKDGAKFSNEAILEMVKFVAHANASDRSHEVTECEAYLQFLMQLYNTCRLNSAQISPDLCRSLSSVSVGLVRLYDGHEAFSELFNVLVKFHSLKQSAECVQFLELVAVKMPKSYLAQYEVIVKPVKDCSLQETASISALISPLSLLVISRLVSLFKSC